MGEGPHPAVSWRSDLDALQFDIDSKAGGTAQCLIHRLAFRALLSQSPTPDVCRAYFHRNRAAFDAAAHEKASRLSDVARFHLTSRDIAKALVLVRDADPAVD